MDEKFFKFWGDLINNTVTGTVRFNEFTDFVKQQGSASGSISNMFKKYYGLETMDETSPEYSTVFQEAVTHFNDALGNFYSAMDVVPKKDYLDLEKKYTALKQKMADLEEVVKHLKVLFKSQSPGAEPDIEKGIASLNQMLKSQNKNFVKMMDSLAGFYGLSKDENKKE